MLSAKKGRPIRTSEPAVHSEAFGSPRKTLPAAHPKIGKETHLPLNLVTFARHVAPFFPCSPT